MDAPFLQLQFYKKENEQDVLISLIEFLTENGAVLSGKIGIHEGHNIKNKPFSGRTDFLIDYVSVRSMNDLHALQLQQDLRIVEIPLLNATGLNRKSQELVTITRISEEAATQDTHPIAIWTSGENINLPTAQSRTLATRAYQKFIDIVERLDPIYAAITVEYDLECLIDLRRDLRSYAFGNFYLSSSFFDSSLIQRVREICSDSFIRQLDNGIYLSISGLFAPKPSTNPKDASSLSAQIGKLIASSRLAQ